MYIDENGLARVTLKIKAYLKRKMIANNVLLTSNGDALLTSDEKYLLFTENTQQNS